MIAPVAQAAAPSEPVSVFVVSRNQSVQVMWNPPTGDGGTPITDYEIDYKEHTDSLWSLYPDTISTNTSVIIDQLINDVEYDFRVRAVNADGIGPSSIIFSQTPSVAPYLFVLSTGQSLAIGTSTESALSTTQPYDNLSLSSPDGPRGYSSPLIPLVERNVETPSSGLANSLRAYDSVIEQPVIIALHGDDGVEYNQLKKGTPLYDLGMLQASVVKNEVGGIAHNTLVIPVGVTLMHGETDYVMGNATAYESFLEEWQEDYENDIQSIFETTESVPLFITQMNTAWTGEVAVAQYEAHKNNPEEIILIGPTYQYAYGPDNLHLTSIDSKNVGELFAKVMHKVSVDHEDWHPLMPESIERSENIITVEYAIPEAPLVFDTDTVAERNNYGFEFIQTGGNSVTIENVTLIDNANKVQITLSDIPTGTEQKLRYAWGCYFAGVGYGQCGSKDDGEYVGGNLRDSDESVSPSSDGTGLPLYNWGVSFEENVVAQPSDILVTNGGGNHSSGNNSHPRQISRRLIAYLQNR